MAYKLKLPPTAICNDPLYVSRFSLETNKGEGLSGDFKSGQHIS